MPMYMYSVCERACLCAYVHVCVRTCACVHVCVLMYVPAYLSMCVARKQVCDE